MVNSIGYEASHYEIVSILLLVFLSLYKYSPQQPVFKHILFGVHIIIIHKYLS